MSLNQSKCSVFSLTLLSTLILTACGGGGADTSSGSASTSAGQSQVTPAPASPVVEETPAVQAPVITAPEIQQPTQPAPEATVRIGSFIDSAVQGLRYRTETQSGTTDARGYFNYLEGERVTFSIGDIEFPSVDAKAIVTPLDVFSTEQVSDARVLNMARLLQTLDNDGMPGNGITISAEAHNQANGVTVDFAALDFDQQVQDVVANAGAELTSLISAQAAMTHLNVSLGNEVAVSRECGVDTLKMGYTGTLSTIWYEVAGTVTVRDNCTLEVTMFTYVDGGAPNVQFYTGDNLNFTGAGSVGIGPKLDGQTFRNETILLSLPEGLTVDDFDSLSVWCIDFNIDFGSTILRPPTN